jgi:CubicO group peptidase (beta-lactamase class C family)
MTTHCPPPTAIAAACVLSLGIATPCAAQEPALASMLPAFMDSARIPGLSIAVIRDGRVAWTGAYGHVNDTARTPVDRQTVFAAASLSKPVFAYAVMRLAERDAFDIDRPLAEYLPYERLEHEDSYRAMTARHVMMHASGLRNWQEGRLDLLFAPGNGFNYSGEGFVYLQKVIEHVTGLTIEHLARREVFDPLGMTRTSYVWQEAFAGNAATGTNEDGRPRPLPHLHQGNAAHSLLTTATDYARFVVAAMSGQGLADTTLAQMLRPHHSAHRPRNPTAGDPYVFWGLGWGLQQGTAGRALFHWGDNGAWRCYVVVYPERQTGVVYFTNSVQGLSIVRAVVSQVVEDEHWAVDWIGYAQYNQKQTPSRQ